MLKNNLRVREKKGKVIHEIGEDSLRELRRIREESVERIEENIDLLREALRDRDAELKIARDGSEASGIVTEICKRYRAKLVLKSKSLTTEEIYLNGYLESEGIEVVETDLGERIVQLAGQRPSHILGPAFHMTRYEIAEMLSKHYGEPVDPDPADIVLKVRSEFRRKYPAADVVITGANMIVAENGAVVLVTNEGNDRMSVAFAPVHIVVAGVEKLVRTTGDALKILEILPRYATGQRLSSYVSFHVPTSKRYPRDGVSGPRRMVYVLIDNGRISASRDPELREALMCIRCASCLQVCPPYNFLSGHVFGHIYSGPMGIPWTMIAHGLENTYFAQLCNFCGLCKEACPVKIDLPYINSVVKERYGKRFGHPPVNKFLKNYESIVRLGGKVPKISNFILKSRSVRWVAERLVGIDSRGGIPEFSENNLGRLFREEGVERRGKVALVTELLVYYMFPEWGLKASRILSRLGFKVTLPPQRSSGMPLIQHGFLEEARRVADQNVRLLHELVERGYKIVSLEPTAHYCLVYYYPKLLNNGASRKVAENSYGFFEFLKLLGWGEVAGMIRSLNGTKTVYHLPCHSRTRDGSLATKEFLEAIGAEVMFKEVGCCGQAGTWGMRKDGLGYDLSTEIGKYVVKEYEDLGGDMIVTESSVCFQHLKRLSRMKCSHVFDLIELV